MTRCSDPAHVEHSGSRWHKTTQPLTDDLGRPYHDRHGNPIIYPAVYPCPVAAELDRALRQETPKPGYTFDEHGN